MISDLFAADMTSASLVEPPGEITAVIPASISTSRPSANGKNASLAATLPKARCSPARKTANRAESTRFTWPIPIPTAAKSLASKIPFDLTQRIARQANSKSARVSGSAIFPETNIQLATLSGFGR